MASPAPQSSSEAAPATAAQHQSAANDENDVPELTVDHSDADSALGSINSDNSETTSINSGQYKGYIHNGRRYQTIRTQANTEYYQPSDEKQWESMEAGHMLMLILDSQRSNTLFRSPISPNWQHIIDLGTGSGEWAIDVADRYPHVTVRGVDLFPPPIGWTAPNCIYEVDDISKPWTWNQKFDLAHMRHLIGSFSNQEWETLYARIYDNLQPGGWIEQVEQGEFSFILSFTGADLPDIGVFCDDGTLPADSLLVTKWRDLFMPMAERIGRPLDMYDHMRSRIEAAGFTNVQQQEYKEPIGTWPSLQVYKDAGKVCKQQFKHGVEGWTMWMLTTHGSPTPWTPHEVQVYLAKIRNEVDQGWHIYHKARRVWAQKPLDAGSKATHSESAAENVSTPPQTETRVEATPEQRAG